MPALEYFLGRIVPRHTRDFAARMSPGSAESEPVYGCPVVGPAHLP